MAESARMASAASPVWTLSQASAWVVFRDHSVVGLFSPPEPESWVAHMMYPDAKVKQIGERLEIFHALRDGRIAAFGRRPEPGTLREEIPAHEWHDLFFDVLGPYRRLQNGTKDEPWRDIYVLRSKVERIWSRASSPNGRAAYDRSWIRDRYVELKKLHGALSKNDLIVEVQLAYQTAFDGIDPPRPTIQRYIKDL